MLEKGNLNHPVKLEHASPILGLFRERLPGSFRTLLATSVGEGDLIVWSSHKYDTRVDIIQ